MAETTYNITLTANHQSLTAEHLPLAAESVQYLTAKVICETDDWTGREIKAMFGRGCTVYEVPVTGGEITAKQQLNLTAGDWRVWLVGNSARDGEVIPRITTNVAHIRVAPTGGTEGNPFPATPPTVEEQLRADMGNLADLTTEDKSNLVAAINEVRQTGGGGVQPDWNQNDSTQPDYVKNRPFYTGDPVGTVLVEESTVSFAADDPVYMGQLPSTFEATVGETYKVYWDGAAYECTCVDFNSYPVIGNLSIMDFGSDTGEPFLMLVDNGRVIEIYTADTSASHTFSICVFAPEVVKIDEKYLPVASEGNYGVVKKSEIVTSYKFDLRAPHDLMVDAITAFKTGNANIVWSGYKVIDASYDSSNDTISVVFAKEPLEVLTCSNYDGFYIRTLGSPTYGELQGNQVRIVNDEGVYAVLSTKGVKNDTTLSVGAERIHFYSGCGLSKHELILKSSTENSTKQFRITVDDSGTITATEVS